MSEKQFEHIENRIREAAENSEPAFDEYAWSLMEARLNKEVNRKRPIFIWGGLMILLLIIGSNIYFIGNNKPVEKLTLQQADLPISAGKSPEEKNTALGQTISDTASDVDPKINLIEKTNTVGREPGQLAGKDNNSYKTQINVSGKKQGKTKGNMLSKSSAGEIAENQSDLAQNNFTEIMPEKVGMDTMTDKRVSDIDPQLKEIEDTSSLNNKAVLPQKNNKEKKIKEAKPARLYLLAAIGADVGSVHFLSFGNSKVSPKYGIGFGYQVSKKISLQTGFYASNKKYIAGPEDYNTKAGTYWSMVQIVKVDAACLVYDIPLTFRYNLLQKSKTGYYATVGLSSYIMKKEDYNYYYVRYNMPHEAAKTYTGNSKLFSVFNLSAGIEKKLSPAIYIQAEPSVGIPISGVGEGNVKLYSAALQVAIKYQPVKRKK